MWIPSTYYSTIVDPKVCARPRIRFSSGVMRSSSCLSINHVLSRKTVRRFSIICVL